MLAAQRLCTKELRKVGERWRREVDRERVCAVQVGGKRSMRWRQIALKVEWWGIKPDVCQELVVDFTFYT